MVNIIKDGDLFTVPADILINPVNRMGISGAGLAKEFKRRFPAHDAQWKKNCEFAMPLNELFFVLDAGLSARICYFPTKHLPRDVVSDTALIEGGLQFLKKACDEAPMRKQRVINMPALGCGLGGLDFEGVIKPLIIDSFQNEPYTINLFEPK